MHGQRRPLAASSIDRDGAPLSLTSMRPAKPHDNGRSPAIQPCPLPTADEGAVCAPGYRGRKRGEVVRTRTTALQIHTRQWIGTYAGKGNGDYRGELASALRAITGYLKHFAFPPEMALVRLDGAGCAMRPSSLNCFWPAPLAFRAGEAICSWSIPTHGLRNELSSSKGM